MQDLKGAFEVEVGQHTQNNQICGVIRLKTGINLCSGSHMHDERLRMVQSPKFWIKVMMACGVLSEQ